GDAGRLLVALSSASGRPSGNGTEAPLSEGQSSAAQGPEGAAIRTATRRLDVLADAARVLLEGASISESVLLQRCARLLSGSLATWAIVDSRRRGQLRRHYVAGPDDPESSGLAHAVATADPGPGSVPEQAYESGQTVLLTHVADDMALGPSP